jgi:hypothetical protein
VKPCFRRAALRVFWKVGVAIAGSVVGERAADGEAEARVVGAGYVEEADCRTVLLVVQDGGEADAGAIVDGHIEVLVPCAAGLAGAVAVDAMAWLDNAARRLMSKWIRSPGRLCS